MTFFHVNLMWAIVLFGILLWTTAIVSLNAAMRRGMRLMGMLLSYLVLVWMLVEMPWLDALVTWGVFAAVGGVLTFVYELWARRRYAGTGRAPRSLVNPFGVLLWPALIPDAVGLMFNDAGIIPADERSETHQEDTRRITGELPVPSAPEQPRKRALYDLR
jgi:hypothetical protein